MWINHLNGLKSFFDKCRRSDFFISLEESTQGYSIAREIYERQKDIARVHFYLLSNASLSSRVTSVKSDDKSRQYQVWDIVRLANIERSGKAREDMVVKFDEGSHVCPPIQDPKPANHICWLCLAV